MFVTTQDGIICNLALAVRVRPDKATRQDGTTAYGIVAEGPQMFIALASYPTPAQALALRDEIASSLRCGLRLMDVREWDKLKGDA